MKSFGLCHEIISPVILKSFGLSQDLPLSQNGQKFRRGKIGQWAKRIEGANGANGRWVWLRGLIWPSWIIIGPVAPSGPVFISLPSCRRGCISCLSLDGSPGGLRGRSIWCRWASPLWWRCLPGLASPLCRP